MRQVIELGYNDRASADQVARLMSENEKLLLVDTRIKPWSNKPEWQRPTLEQQYGKRYRYAGDFLGNLHYKNPQLPFKIVNIRQGIHGLITLLTEGYDLLLLCQCPVYAKCHRKVIVEALEDELERRGLPAVDVMHSYMYKNMIVVR